MKNVVKHPHNYCIHVDINKRLAKIAHISEVISMMQMNGIIPSRDKVRELPPIQYKTTMIMPTLS